MNEFKIIEHMSYDWMIAAYFFLGGLSAGSYVLSVVANYWRKDLKPLAPMAAVIAPLFLALGMLILLIDLGQPLRFFRLLISLNPRSALSWGVWFLNAFFFISVAYAWFLKSGDEAKARKFGYLGIPFALLVGSYTAVLLGQAPGRVLWHSALMAPIFLLGGLVSGIAAVMLLSALSNSESVSSYLCKLLAWLLILEAGLVLVEILNLFNGGAEAVAMAKHIVIGQYSFLFWAIEIALGIALPVHLLLKNRVTPKAKMLASILVLVGIFAMRYIVVVGGQVPTF